LHVYGPLPSNGYTRHNIYIFIVYGLQDGSELEHILSVYVCARVRNAVVRWKQ
jgi:hypothetical protein